MTRVNLCRIGTRFYLGQQSESCSLIIWFSITTIVNIFDLVTDFWSRFILDFFAKQNLSGSSRRQLARAGQISHKIQEGKRWEACTNKSGNEIHATVAAEAFTGQLLCLLLSEVLIVRKLVLRPEFARWRMTSDIVRRCRTSRSLLASITFPEFCE